jgi:hypothetical protein
VKKSFYLAAAAALLIATTSAHAGGFSFEIGGQKIHIDAPRNCSSLDCLSVSNNGSKINLKNMNLKGKNSDDDDVASNSPPPAPPAPVANNAPPAPVAPPPVQQAAPVAQPANTPLGLWQTADNKGNVRIEQCGANLCGYSEHGNDQILINMKPASDNKWTGRIHDPDSGSNYDSTIALKTPNLLKVQGCAFGGQFCGGQTWKRIG